MLACEGVGAYGRNIQDAARAHTLSLRLEARSVVGGGTSGTAVSSHHSAALKARPSDPSAASL